MVKNLPTSAGDTGNSFVPRVEDPLQSEMATHSSILAWKIPWTEEPGGLQCTGSERWDTTERVHMSVCSYKMLVSMEILNRIACVCVYML